MIYAATAHDVTYRGNVPREAAGCAIPLCIAILGERQIQIPLVSLSENQSEDRSASWIGLRELPPT